MSAYTPDQIMELLDRHGKWRRGEEGGQRANLQGAKLTDESVIAPGPITLADLVAVLPEFLGGGGVALEAVCTRENLTCHSWSNCPTAVAYGAEGMAGVPLHWRPWAHLFIWAFDAHLLPPERIAAACGVELAGGGGA